MTEAATSTFGRWLHRTGRHMPFRPTADGGCEFRSSCGHYVGVVRPDGSSRVRDLSGGEPGVEREYRPDGTGCW